MSNTRLRDAFTNTMFGSNARLRDALTNTMFGSLAGSSPIFFGAAIMRAADGDGIRSTAFASAAALFAFLGYYFFAGLDPVLGRLDKKYYVSSACLMAGALGIAVIFNPSAKPQDQQPQQKLVAPAAAPAPSTP